MSSDSLKSRTGFNSNRGGARQGSGRPKLVTPSTRVVRVPFDVDIQLALDCYYAVLDAQENKVDSPRHDALNKFVGNLLGEGSSV